MQRDLNYFALISIMPLIKTYLGKIKFNEKKEIAAFEKYKSVDEAYENLKQAEREAKSAELEEFYEFFVKNQNEIIKKFKISKKELEKIKEISKEALLKISEDKIARTSENREKVIIQLVSAISDIDACINLLKSRAEEIEFYRESEIYPELKKQIKKLRELREKIERKIEREIEIIAPNLNYLLGSMLAAMLIAKAGSLEKLAKMSGSKIQVLGAEKAMFRFLRTRKKPPKHGIIFLHPLLMHARKKHRGKIARTLAAKTAIAAKADFYGSSFIADELKKEVEERIKTLRSNGK